MKRAWSVIQSQMFLRAAHSPSSAIAPAPDSAFRTL
jgi:hypothetical protein